MINNKDLDAILSDWSFWNNKAPQSGLITRKINLPKQLHQDLALLIQGVRRCGKSTLMRQIPSIYNFNLAHCYYCNFEDPRLLGALDHTLLSQIVELAKKKVSKEDSCYFFFDEIQNVQHWEKWLHTQLEQPKNNYFILTGSNSCLLNNEYGTVLTGRHLSIELFPFSFAEYKILLPQKTFSDYIISGGFPRTLSFDEPYKLLQEYFNDIILRDVLKRIHARTPDAIKQVVKMTFDSCGAELSYRKIAAATGLTVDTVKSYLDACEEAYLLFACQFFSFSERKRQLKQKKYYPIDPGLRYAVTSNLSRDLGKSLEILVFLHLKKSYEQVYYWQEIHQGEVDFVTVRGQTITPYQVTWDGIEPRHEKALTNFYAAFPQAAEAIFITKDNAEEFLNN